VEIWTAVAETPDLAMARDLAIDGRIHLLLEDGRALTFSRGALIGTLAPFVVPSLESAAFLAEAPFSDDFYIVDRAGTIDQNVGRIVRMDAEGAARQILTPAAAPGDAAAHLVANALAGAEDVAIDELSGTVYWVSSGEIWRASLPLS
jgi:hypothetical protein